MEYTELSRLWETNKSADIKISLNQNAINEVTVNKLKSSLSEIKLSSIIEIVVNFVWLGFLVDFAIKYYQETYFLLAGIILFGISIFSIVLEINKLYLFSSIDNSFSVFKAQKRIEKLKFLEKLDVNLLYFIIPMFFVPFVLVITKGILNIDLFQLGFGGYDIALATAGSAIIAMLVVFFLRKSQFKSINESLKFLKELNQNEYK
jgi:hypothetical protein